MFDRISRTGTKHLRSRAEQVRDEPVAPRTFRGASLHWLSAALAFCVLAAGTLAVGTAMLEQQPTDRQLVQLPRVEITGKRVDAKVAHAEQVGASALD